MTKKLLALLTALTMAAACMVSCGSSDNDDDKADKDKSSSSASAKDDKEEEKSSEEGEENKEESEAGEESQSEEPAEPDTGEEDPEPAGNTDDAEYVEVLDKFFNAIITCDGNMFIDVLPTYMNGVYDEMLAEMDEYEDLADYYEQFLLKPMYDGMVEDYGGNISLEYTVLSSEQMDASELSDLEAELNENISMYPEIDTVTVDDGYYVTISMTVKGDSDSETDESSLSIYKVNGSWCLDMTSFLF